MSPEQSKTAPETLVPVTINGKTELMKLSDLPITDIDQLIRAGVDLWESDEDLDPFLANVRKAHGISEQTESPELPTYDVSELLGAAEGLWGSDEELDAFLADLRKAHGKPG
jgi:hypothetical protein